jgi:uncharacterized YigZ family protein
LSKSYPVPGATIREELLIVNSRFIATLSPALTVGQAKDFMNTVKQEFYDASHNVPAYIIGGGNTRLEFCSDDGEPSGTAGKPALAVLHGSGLGDVAIVVTRYFGGTKLGTGGLVRAYTQAVQLVVQAVPRAVKVAISTVILAVPYPLYEPVRALIARCAGKVVDESFAADVTFTLQFQKQQLPVFQSMLLDVTSGRIQAIWVSDGEELIPWEDYP